MSVDVDDSGDVDTPAAEIARAAGYDVFHDDRGWFVVRGLAPLKNASEDRHFPLCSDAWDHAAEKVRAAETMSGVARERSLDDARRKVAENARIREAQASGGGEGSIHTYLTEEMPHGGFLVKKDGVPSFSASTKRILPDGSVLHVSPVAFKEV